MRIRDLNPTLKQAKIIQSNGLDSEEWLIKKVLSDRLLCIHRITGLAKEAYLKAVQS